MIRHAGDACRGCGTVLLSLEERESRVCDTCCDWQGVVRMAQPAISYATREVS